MFLVNFPCSRPQQRGFRALGMRCDVGGYAAGLSIEAFSLKLCDGA